MANSRTITHGELRDRLAKLVQGPVLGAGDPAYEESRRVFNAMIERRPAAILKCSGRRAAGRASLDRTRGGPDWPDWAGT